VPVFGFALLWAGLAAAITLRVARSRAGLPFAPTWWSCQLPVGTCVTGASGLARISGATAYRLGLAVILFAGLLAAWVVGLDRSLAVGPGPARDVVVLDLGRA